MAVWGRVRKAPYPAAAVLAAAVSGKSWHVFDGWCASQNIEPEKLRWDRFLNLVYFYLIKDRDKKSRAEVDSEIAKAVSTWNAEIIRNMQPVQRVMVESETGNVVEHRGRLPKPPPWWDGDNAAKQNMLVAQQLSSLKVKSR